MNFDMDSINHDFRMLKYQIAEEYCAPSAVYRPKIYLDGNKWCALYGYDLQSGVAGFGDSPHLAARDFDVAWHQNASKPEVIE
jgi:hypothetical protein